MQAVRTLARPAARQAMLSGPSVAVRGMSATPAVRYASPALRMSAAYARAPFSTSHRLMADAEKKVEAEKEAENKIAGEAMGAKDESSAKSDSSSGGEANKAVEELQTSIKEKDARIKELTDAVLYGKADLQNAQRRAKEEKTQAADYAITKFARDLTSSLDILHLALRSVPENLRAAPADVSGSEDPRKAVAELYSGVDLTSKSILDMLKMHGVTSFDPTGEKFNPQEHEAMYQAPVPGKEPGTVLECSKVGFKIKDRVLRAAQVGVVQETS